MVTSPRSIDLHKPVLWMQAGLALYEEVRAPEAVDRTKFCRALAAKIAGAARTIGVGGLPKLHGATHQLLSDRIKSETFLWARALTCSLLSLTSVNPRHLMSVIGKLWTVGATVGSDALDRLGIVPGRMGMAITAEVWAALTALVDHSSTLISGLPQLARGYEQVDRSLRPWGACWQCRPLLTVDAPAFSDSGDAKELEMNGTDLRTVGSAHPTVVEASDDR
jgi:UDP-N-acetylglucosamine enolpyruvyl transferase